MKEISKKTTKIISSFFTDNVGLKAIALISAALLWLLVVNLDDPKQSRNFTATVNVINEEVLTDEGKYYELPNGNTVTFRVTARRSVIEGLSSSDFTAEADMKYLEDDTRVPIEISAKRNSNQISISSKTHYLTVTVGDTAETTFMIHATSTGDPGDGFEVGSITVTPDVISVFGPADVVSSIENVAVAVDVSGQVEDITVKGVPKLYNSDGQEIDKTGLELSEDSVEVFVDLLSVQEVGLAVETSGSLSDGLELEEIKTDPEKVLLRGQAEVLNNLTILTIPAGVIDLDEIKDDFETTIDISSYHPAGVSMAKNSSSQVKVLVNVVSHDSAIFDVKTSNLTVQNLSPGLICKFRDKTVEVAIDGLESALSELDAKTITGSVDASGLSEGVHSVAVTLDLDEGLEARTATTDIIVSFPGDLDDEKKDISDGTAIDVLEVEEDETETDTDTSEDEEEDEQEEDTTEDIGDTGQKQQGNGIQERPAPNTADTPQNSDNAGSDQKPR